MENDLQDVGIDLGDERLMTSRTWPWLRTRILGRLSADTRTARALIPQEALVGAGPGRAFDRAGAQ